MSTETATSADDGGENTPLFLGIAVIVIILIAFFSSKSGNGAEKAAPAAEAAPAAPKKSKKKKAASKKKKAAPAKEPEPEPEPEPESEPEVVKVAPKKKKKKPKKKKAAAPAAAPAAEAPQAVEGRDDDDDSDDDDDLWRIQSASNRKGANDAAKRAAANKERDRVRALKKKEEREAKAAAERAAAEEVEKAAAAEAAAIKAAEEAEAKKKAEADAAAKKKNGATANGDAAAAEAPAGEKKKRKRKKKKGGAAVDEPRDPLVKPATAPAERWEVVPAVEEWQEVGHKKSKQKAKVEAAAAAALAAEANSAFLSDEQPAEEPGETSVSIPAGDDPLILIGKGGSTIQALQANSGAKFHLNRTTNVLTISGAEDAVQAGLEEARAILNAEAERKANEATEKVTWGADAIKAVIGRGGSNIRAAQEATGVKIDADVEAGTLVIVGPSERVASALTMCHNFAFGEVQETLELVSRNAVNLVYGQGFETIRGLQESTGCKLDIARGTTTLKLAGSAEAVADATSRVRALLEANRGFEMTIENSKVGAVYGKGGETLRSIQDRTGTQVDVTRGPTHATVSVMGTAEAAARARGMLQRAIDGEVELQPGEVAEEVELGSATAAVIGRGGSKASELEKKHGVKINVRSELQKARVVGKPDKVAAAVKDVEAIAKPILDAEAAQKKADEAVESGESAWQVDAGDDDADGW